MNHNILLTELIANGIIIGTGATIIMDIWGLMLQKILRIAPLNFALVGRWLAYMPKGTFQHDNIRAVKPLANELFLGWFTHYLIGIIFATVLIIISGNEWLNEPSLLLSIIFGIITVVFPFFLMQPGMGLGIAASKTPKPNVARLRSISTHLIFGLGLYLSAMLNTYI